MRIIYIFRHPSKERSIERVFEPIISRIKKAGYHVDVKYAKYFRFWPLAMIRNIIYFARLSRTNICHITGDVQYVACLMNPENTVLTIHDLVSLHNEKTPWWFKQLVYWFWYYIPLRRLKYITCISEATKKDLITYFPWTVSKLLVINNPVGDEFVLTPLPSVGKLPIILHMGTRSNKNLLRVIEAMKGVNAVLRIIGKLDDVQKKTLDATDIIYSNAYNLTDQDILKEYHSCSIVSFPSLFEGFGMPIIEAQAVGRPVVTSNREPMITVAGSAAIFVDPENVESIREGFIKIISDNRLQEKYIAMGCNNVKRYTSSTIAATYVDLYELIMRNR